MPGRLETLVDTAATCSGRVRGRRTSQSALTSPTGYRLRLYYGTTHNYSNSSFYCRHYKGYSLGYKKKKGIKVLGVAGAEVMGKKLGRAFNKSRVVSVVGSLPR
jgi:hypothetical protein